MVELPEDRTLKPGTWYLWRTGKRRIFVACPLCGQVVLLDPEDIEVGKDGRLSRIIKCPRLRCDFTDAIRLKSWGEFGSSSTLPKV